MANVNLWTDLEDKVDAGLPSFTPENLANKDTDGTLAANSDTKYPSQKAAKTYVDARVLKGSGTPEGAVVAPVGTMFLRTNGGANTTLYVKESGSGNTGWVAK